MSTPLADDVLIESLRLSVRSTNCCLDAGLLTVGAVRAKSDADLLRTRNFSRKVLAEVRAVLAGEEQAAGPIIPPWTRLPCEQCGCEALATRSEPGRRPFVCSDCESHARGMEAVTNEATARWAVHSADFGSAELNDLLRDGWEPFAAVSEVRQGAFRQPDTQVVVVVLRREARRG